MRILWLAPANRPYIDDGPLSTSDFLSCAWKVFAERGATQYAILPPDSICTAFTSAVTSGGTFQPDALLHPDETDGTALPKMLEIAERIHMDFDAVVNLGHDVLPHQWMAEGSAKIFSLPTLCNLGRRADRAILTALEKLPKRFMWSSEFQMRSFGVERGVVARQPFDLNVFPEQDGNPSDYLLFAGHLVPEKGLHYAAITAKKLGIRLLVCGGNPNQKYVKQCLEINPAIDLMGQCSRTTLFGLMAGALALLQFQEAQEAFTRVTAEALLCGCPVISCGNKSNLEFVSVEAGDGCVADFQYDAASDVHTFLVSPVDRVAIQRRAMERFSPTVWANRLAQMILRSHDNEDTLRRVAA